MVSPELIRRYPFFGFLNHDQRIVVAKAATEQTSPAGHRFFDEGDELNEFRLVVEGAVSIAIPVTDSERSQDVSGQLTGDMKTTDLTVSTVGTGDIFGWSALIPPTIATAGAITLIVEKIRLTTSWSVPSRSKFVEPSAPSPCPVPSCSRRDCPRLARARSCGASCARSRRTISPISAIPPRSPNRRWWTI